MQPIIKDLTIDSQAHLSLGEEFISLENETRKKGRESFLDKLICGKYCTEPLPCLCGAHDDKLIAEIDRYGIPLRTVLCMNCGLMRSDPYYTAKTLADFYANEYRSIYSNNELATSEFFENQKKAGRTIWDFVKPYLNDCNLVFEVGTGAGGILAAIQEEGVKVRGCDLGLAYLEYGRNRCVDLLHGELDVLQSEQKADLVILNHLIEHIKDPANYIKQVKTLLRPGGMIYIGLPGLLCAPLNYNLKYHFYLQNAHCYHYCLDTLKFMMAKAGMRLVLGNEEIRSVFKVGEDFALSKSATAKFNLEFIKNTEKQRLRVGKMQAKLSDSESKIAEQLLTINKCEELMAARNEEINHLRERLNSREMDIEDLVDQLQRTSTRLKITNKKLRNIEQSASWKVLKSLRFILQAVFVWQILSATRKIYNKYNRGLKKKN